MVGDAENLGERIARIEEAMEEFHRQQTASWRRIDENDQAVSEMKLLHVQAQAKVEAEISHLEREQMKEAFSLDTKIAGIKWKVGVMVGAALFILNFVVSRLDLGRIFDSKTEQQKSTRR